MRRLTYTVPLSAMVILVFATIALAEDSPDQSSSDPNSPNQTQNPNPSEQATPTENETTVSILDNAFDPTQLDIAGGTTVTWVNEDTVSHTVTADNGLFDSGEIPPGYSYSVWFDGSGMVPYHCKIHPEMKGGITVVGASGEGDTSSEEPTSEFTNADPTETSEGLFGDGGPLEDDEDDEDDDE